MLLDPKSGEPTRTHSRFDTDVSPVDRRRTKERVSVKNGEPIPRIR
jgi:hypothetical protein